MNTMLFKFLIAVSAGLVGGFVNQRLGVEWGLAMLVGVALGFWLSSLVQ